MKFHTTWHFFHLVMTLITAGFWLIIWVWRALANAQANRRQQF